MAEHYILEGMIPVPCDDFLEWAQWYQTAERHVAQDTVEGVRISTVFLGLNHQFGHSEIPILFETMVFGGAYDQEQERYSTWEQAEVGHRKWVKLIAES